MSITPQHNANSCNKWLSHLTQLNILKIADKVGHFLPPCRIIINENIYSKILTLYDPRKEKGGIMFASITQESGYINLEIKSINVIGNNVEKVFPGSSKNDAYYPNQDLYLKLLSRNFSKKNFTRIYFPIHFHTHPTRDMSEDIKYFNRVIDPLDMSPQDIIASNNRNIQLGDLSLFYLNAIITGDREEHRIIFYGNKVTPSNYLFEKGMQVFKAVEDLTGEIENDFWRIASRIAIGSFAAIATFKSPLMARSVLDVCASTLDKKEFWGKLEKGRTVINIPYRQVDILNN